MTWPLSVVVKSPAKINIGLYICNKRPDGYHNIETVLYPIAHVYDTLRIRIFPAKTHSEFHLVERGPLYTSVPPESNLIFRAYTLIKSFIPFPHRIIVEIWKRIPVGAGLGGGSSNAAIFLSTITKVLNLPISKEKLHQIAADLGSDVPFFLYCKPMYATGTGTILTPISLDLSAYQISVVTPPVSISTAEAYSLIQKYLPPPESLSKLLQETQIPEWKEIIHNQFEPVVFQKYPILAQLKEKLYQKGALYASLSGSGSALFAIFPKPGK